MSEINEIEDEFFVIEDEEAEIPLNLHLVRDRTQKELNSIKSKLKELVNDKKSGYNISTIDNIELVTYQGKIYVPKSLRRRTLEWYHHFLNHPDGDRLYHILQTVCYWKGMSMQAVALCKKCDDCQRYKPRKRKY